MTSGAGGSWSWNDVRALFAEQSSEIPAAVDNTDDSHGFVIVSVCDRV